jgi:hypothetical protein
MMVRYGERTVQCDGRLGGLELDPEPEPEYAAMSQTSEE